MLPASLCTVLGIEGAECAKSQGGRRPLTTPLCSSTVLRHLSENARDTKQEKKKSNSSVEVLKANVIGEICLQCNEIERILKLCVNAYSLRFVQLKKFCLTK